MRERLAGIESLQKRVQGGGYGNREYNPGWAYAWISPTAAPRGRQPAPPSRVKKRGWQSAKIIRKGAAFGR